MNFVVQLFWLTALSMQFSCSSEEIRSGYYGSCNVQIIDEAPRRCIDIRYIRGENTTHSESTYGYESTCSQTNKGTWTPTTRCNAKGMVGCCTIKMADFKDQDDKSTMYQVDQRECYYDASSIEEGEAKCSSEQGVWGLIQ